MIARTIEVAGIRLRFCGDRAAAELIDKRYGAFATSEVGDAVEIELRLRPLNTRAPAVDESSQVVVRQGRIVFEWAGVHAEIASDLSSARLSAPLAERPIDAVVRFLLAAHLLERGGLLVHASAVRIDGRAWVFAGPSGAGKSTLAAELDGDLMCDEAVALLPMGDGVEAHSTPYWRAEPRHAAVAGIVFPARAPGPPRWSPLSQGQAVAQLLTTAGTQLPRDTPRVLRVAAALTRSIPCARVTLSSIPQIRHWLQPQLDVGVAAS